MKRREKTMKIIVMMERKSKNNKNIFITMIVQVGENDIMLVKIKKYLWRGTYKIVICISKSLRNINLLMIRPLGFLNF